MDKHKGGVTFLNGYTSKGKFCWNHFRNCSEDN